MDKAGKRLETVTELVEAIRRWAAPYLLPNADVQRISVRTLELKQVSVNHAIERYEKMYEDLKLLPDTSPADIATAKDHYFDFVNDALELDADLEGLKKKVGRTDPAPPAHQQAQGNEWTTAKLPMRELPKFKGSVLDWAEFIDIFTTEVLKCPKFSDCQKLGYLKACLEGPPARLLKNIRQTNENLAVALSLLQDRYQDTDLIRDAHFAKIFSINAMTEQSVSQLRSLETTVVENLQGLKNLKEPVDKWDSWLIYYVKSKMDGITRKEWETHLVTAQIKKPALQTLLAFLQQTAKTLETVNSGKGKKEPGSGSQRRMSLLGQGKGFKCYVCEDAHFMSTCPIFLAATPDQRKVKVRELGLCDNCFSVTHKTEECRRPGCKVCGVKHHPTLHVSDGAGLPVTTKNAKSLLAEQGLDVDILEHEQDRPGDSDLDAESDVEVSACLSSTGEKEILLCTVLVHVESPYGPQVCRCLVDGGSQASFITKSCVQRIQARTKPSLLKVTGLGKTDCKRVERCAQLRLHSVGNQDDSWIDVRVHTLDKITGLVPRKLLPESVKDELDCKLKLADPHFYKPGSIDILLGMDVLPQLLKDDTPLRQNGLFLQSTVFGWMVGGEVGANANVNIVTSLCVSFESEDTDDLLRRFWQLENVQDMTKSWSLEEKRCEEHFEKTHKRLDDGRYEVCLPFRDHQAPVALGNSKGRALALYRKLESRWSKDSSHELKHRENIEEYFKLKHAESVPETDLSKPTSQSFYLPHHGVEKLSSTTTKYRVVFNASAKSSSDRSLNELLMVGPNLQGSISEILARFRTHEVAFSADVEKMYRQISLAQSDRDYHRFLYRHADSPNIHDYRMTTVTFGIASSAHHAQRCLMQLARDENDRYPLASAVIERDMYMDDCLSGASDIPSALELQSQLVRCMSGGGFRLRKWISNEPKLLESIPECDRETMGPCNLDFEGRGVIKTLGVYWTPSSDRMSYAVAPHKPMDESCYTKRLLISDAARVFDPLGNLGPIMMKAKFLFKEIWRLGVGWDDPLPLDIVTAWMKWRKELDCLSEFSFPRCVIPDRIHANEFELHGFSDASEAGYDAVVYVRTIYSDASVIVRQLAAKTKVAPMKTVTLPRLELCGAFLLSQLMANVKSYLSLPKVTLYAWSDSTVALDWIRGEPARWQTFVARRVSEIQDNISPGQWHHCPTELNPADCGSRGLMPSELVTHSLWWHGPDFLQLPSDSWPQRTSEPNETAVMSEAKKVKTVSFLANAAPAKCDMFALFPHSNMDIIIRLTAWCMRWRTKKEERPTGTLTVKELEVAEQRWIKHVQAETFAKELDILQSGKELSGKSHLAPLSPFLDDCGILRVGGRLSRSNLPYSAKHQVLLPREHQFTLLLMDKIHRRNLHASPRLMLAILRQGYWVVNGMDFVRKWCHKCIFCRRTRAQTMQQIMGDLPADRVCPISRPFLKTGVDYAGPFWVKTKTGRGARSYKVWIAYFCCMVTKACHIEVVTSLETKSFLGAFRRFVARRGLGR